jgi:hypothetical protein
MTSCIGTPRIVSGSGMAGVSPAGVRKLTAAGVKFERSYGGKALSVPGKGIGAGGVGGMVILKGAVFTALTASGLDSR